MRHGGRLFSLLPYAVSAREGLRRHLPRMGEYAERARELAAALDPLAGVRVLPQPPHTNSFRLFVDVDEDRLVEAGLRTAEEQHVALAWNWVGADVPGWSMTELVTGDATLAWPVDEQAAAVDRARRPGSQPLTLLSGRRAPTRARGGRTRAPRRRGRRRWNRPTTRPPAARPPSP